MAVGQKELLRREKFGDYWNHELKLVFEDIAARYDAANGFFSLGIWNLIRRRFVRTVSLPPGSKVLDVCAGTNAVGIDLLLRNPELEITALDRSEAMQRIGTARALERGLRIESVISDAHSLPFPDNSFDAVTTE